MKIALIGYGKMGKAIEQIALERGHEIVLRVSGATLDNFTADNLQAADIAIEFSTPEAAFNNVMTCINGGISVVCGTTGWYEHLPTVEEAVQQKRVGLIHATNFSPGVHLFFALNQYLARLMLPHTAYTPSISETHHTQKKDAPSGTALSLATQLLEQYNHLNGWELDSNQPNKLPIHAHRIANVVGLHTVSYTSAIDTLSITHNAHSREGFALGAALAAEYLKGKSGIFSMADVLQIN
ncbi:MAG: 4-hydroxy-tetrahydrodipicolinate reductase [Chitinophagia bacterium]|nr:4-hydroxy-tetrahydrodipicolinate reductase [Chitinophagia bacterium]